MEKKTYIRRRAKLKKDVASGLLLFLGNDEAGMNYADNTYRFRQDSTFLYFFGLDYAGLAAVIDIDMTQRLYSAMSSPSTTSFGRASNQPSLRKHRL